MYNNGFTGSSLFVCIPADPIAWSGFPLVPSILTADHTARPVMLLVPSNKTGDHTVRPILWLVRAF